MRGRRLLCLTAIIVAGLGLAGCDELYSGPARIINLGLRSDSHTGAIMVNAHDTVYAIARRYRLPIREIIDLNGLEPPYTLTEHQRLRLPPPVDYRVRERDTLQSIADLFGVSISRLVTVNRIQPPFRLTVGQLLRIPSEVSPPRTTMASKTPLVKTPPPVVAARPIGGVSRETLAPPPTTIAPPAHGSGFIWPVRGQVVSGYGPKGDGLYNDGINIAAPRGAAVVSAADGVVAYVGSDLKSYGRLVLIRHGGGLMTAYAHLGTASVKKGSVVRKGQVIGSVGTSGSVTTPQLHFEIRQGSKTRDPKAYL